MPKSMQEGTMVLVNMFRGRLLRWRRMSCQLAACINHNTRSLELVKLLDKGSQARPHFRHIDNKEIFSNKLAINSSKSSIHFFEHHTTTDPNYFHSRYRDSHTKCYARILLAVGASFTTFALLSFTWSECRSNGDKSKVDDFCLAVKQGNIAKVESYLKTGHNPNEAHFLGWMPIHLASFSGQERVLELLLEYGADINAPEMFSTISKVAARKRISPMEVLMTRDQMFSSRLSKKANFAGFTPLHYAALNDNEECLIVLLEAGANPTSTDSSGYQAHQYCGQESNRNLIISYNEQYKKQEKQKEIEERRHFPLEKRLKEVIVGQENAIAAVASAIRRQENGWHDDSHPLVFLFLGSSGIGKTEVAKQVAKYIHKDAKQGFIRLDMSEYQEKHEVAKIIGSPPGYIGYDEGGQLTKYLSNCSNAVVLFDEVDKAHPDVLTVLLQLFDEGRLTDGQGKSIECKNAIFVMTSNLASEDIAEYGQQLRLEAQKDKLSSTGIDRNMNHKPTEVSRSFKENVVYPILKKHFKRDEFLGRITEFVYFLPFTRNELGHLVEKELLFWAEKALQRHNMTLQWENDVLAVIADGYNIHYGARSIKYEVERCVISQLASAHELGLLNDGSSINLIVQYDTPADHNKTIKPPHIVLQVIDGSTKRTIGHTLDANTTAKTVDLAW